ELSGGIFRASSAHVEETAVSADGNGNRNSGEIAVSHTGSLQRQLQTALHIRGAEENSGSRRVGLRGHSSRGRRFSAWTFESVAGKFVRGYFGFGGGDGFGPYFHHGIVDRDRRRF